MFEYKPNEFVMIEVYKPDINEISYYASVKYINRKTKTIRYGEDFNFKSYRTLKRLFKDQGLLPTKPLQDDDQNLLEIWV